MCVAEEASAIAACEHAEGQAVMAGEPTKGSSLEGAIVSWAL
jgi:hypothetical protein